MWRPQCERDDGDQRGGVEDRLGDVEPWLRDAQSGISQDAFQVRVVRYRRWAFGLGPRCCRDGKLLCLGRGRPCDRSSCSTTEGEEYSKGSAPRAFPLVEDAIKAGLRVLLPAQPAQRGSLSRTSGSRSTCAVGQSIDCSISLSRSLGSSVMPGPTRSAGPSPSSRPAACRRWRSSSAALPVDFEVHAGDRYPRGRYLRGRYRRRCPSPCHAAC